MKGTFSEMYPIVTFTVMSLNADLMLSNVCHMLRSYASKSIEIHFTLEKASACWCLPLWQLPSYHGDTLVHCCIVSLGFNHARRE